MMWFLTLLLLPVVLQASTAPTLTWNITATATTKGGKKATLLSGVCGEARRGRVHAIMGPSGSGKTTLLNALSNAVPKGSLALTGELLATPDAQIVYVQQEDILFAQLTVQETLDTSATLRLTENQGADDVTPRSIVEKLILDLNLKKARDTKVGDAKTRGISGGEKKRLCIGNECIGTGLMGGRRAGNTVLFADEPTSGLDSYQAQRVVELLKSMATAGDCTVVASIHQPRASIVSLFDDITLVAEGRCVYTGTVTEMPHWFKSLGHPCPPGVNAAEFYIDLISIDNSSPEEERRCRQRIDRLSEAFLRKRTGWTERRGELAKVLAKGASGTAAVAPVAAPAGRRVALPVGGGGVAAVARALRGAAAGVRRGTRTFSVLLRRAWRQVTH